MNHFGSVGWRKSNGKPCKPYVKFSVEPQALKVTTATENKSSKAKSSLLKKHEMKSLANYELDTIYLIKYEFLSQIFKNNFMKFILNISRQLTYVFFICYFYLKTH